MFVRSALRARQTHTLKQNPNVSSLILIGQVIVGYDVHRSQTTCRMLTLWCCMTGPWESNILFSRFSNDIVPPQPTAENWSPLAITVDGGLQSSIVGTISLKNNM